MAVDTSARRTSLALKDPKGTIAARVLESPDAHDEQLGAALSKFLLEQGIVAQQLDALLVGAGPGSFTGLRIGFSLMKGLALAVSKPLFEVPTFDACAYEARNEGGLLIVLDDARREEFFCACYRSIDGRVERLEPDHIIHGNLLEAHLNKYLLDYRLSEADVRVVTVDRIERLGRYSYWQPINVARAIIERFVAHQNGGADSFSVEHLADCKPNYVRAVAAKTLVERGF